MKKLLFSIFILHFSLFVYANNDALYSIKFSVEYSNVNSNFISKSYFINNFLRLYNSNNCYELGYTNFGFNTSSRTIYISPQKSKFNIEFSTVISSNDVYITTPFYSPNITSINIEPSNHNLGTGRFQGTFSGGGLNNLFNTTYRLEIRPKEIKCTNLGTTSGEQFLLYDEPICIQATKGFHKEVYKWRYQYKNANGVTIEGNFTPFKTADGGATIYVKGSDFLSESVFHDLVYREEAISIIPDGAQDYYKPLSVKGVNVTAKPSAPNITKVTFDKPKCPNKPATNITVLLDRPIAKGENIVLQFIDDSNNQKKIEIDASICGSNEIRVDSIEARKWKIIYFKTTYKNKNGKDVSSNSEGEKMRAQIEITAPEQLSLNFKTSTKTKCYGDSKGEISCHIKGGTGSKTYSLFRENVLVKTLIKGNSETCDFKGLSAGTYSISATDANGCESENKEEITVGEPTPVTLSASTISNPKCQGSYDGVIKYNASGGTGNIKCYLQNLLHEVKDSTYSNSFSGLSAGTYFLCAKDTNNCVSDTIKTRLEAPEALFLSLETKNVTINGTDNGSLSASFGGGTEPYTLSFDNRKLFYQFPLENHLLDGNMYAGEGIVTLLDNNGCYTSKNYNITEPDPISATIKQIDFIKCFGDNTASLQIDSITGGMGGYSVEWIGTDDFTSKDTIISNLPAGYYLVTVKDSVGAIINYEITIDEPNKINLLSSVTNTACVGEASGSILLNANGGTAPYKFSLNEQYSTNGEYNQLGIGSYNVSVEDENGCTTNSIVEVKTLSDINLNVTSSSPSCYNINNGTISISIDNGVRPYYVRCTDDNFLQVENNLELTNLEAGNYNIEVKDALGCIKTAETILIKPEEFSFELPEKIYLCNEQSKNINIESERVTNVDWYLNNDLIHTGLNNKLTQEGVYRLDFLYDEQCHSFKEISVDTINKKVDANFLVAAEVPINDDAHLINITPKENYEYVEWIYPTNDAWVYGEDEHSFQLVFLNEGIYQVGMIAHNDKCTASLFKTIKTFTPSGNNASEDNTYHITDLSIDKSPNNGKFISYVSLSAKTDVKLYLYNASTGHIIATKEVSGEKSYEIPFSVNATAGEYILLVVAPQWQKSQWIKMIIK